jgi:hypothetical protein
MKKLLCFFLCFLIILTLTGCQYKVPDPMQYPDYTFSSEPTTDELRQMAVKAMRDILSIQWHTEKEIRYRKNGPVNKKEFVHEPGNIYAGLLYSSASTGLFQFFEYYNTKTGCLEYPGTADELKMELGNSCADALLWSWSTVCNSIKGGFYPVLMVPNNGYIAVGDYAYRQTIQSYNEMPSYAIIENNGNDVIMEAYSKMLPADALLSTSDNHAKMVIEAPVIVRKSDGTIDPENSYVMIQDQRAGGATFYVETVNGHTLNYSGKLSEKTTFATLLEKNYIPVTTAEFLGLKPYEKAVVTASKTCSTLTDLKELTIEANYPLAVINILEVKGKNHTVLKRQMFGAGNMHGVPRTFSLSGIAGLDTLSPAAGSTIKVEVVVSTGERFYPISFEYK